MSKLVYNWKRFWCPRGGNINLSDSGYLSDPDSKWGHIHNPHVIPFESLARIPCLVLLGEPGIGKTHALQAERKDIDAAIEQKGDKTFWLDLRSYRSEERLVRNLFENETFAGWAQGNHQLHVFLDSLDECLLRIDTLAALLVDEFKKYPTKRLRLRIACRTADWPATLENGLQELWGKDAMAVYELAPLRRVDVTEAARSNGLDQNVFLQEIDRAEVVPFAIKPVTLGFLLNIYRKHGRFPKTQTELYLEGCRLLCEESNEHRRDARLTGALSAEQRLAIAARVAAVTIFSNRSAIWTGIDRGDVPEEDVTVRALCGGRETALGNEPEVDEAAIKEILATGLFSARGPNRMGWAHQTYAEFLAAHYLVQHHMALPQMISLIVHPGDPDGELVPQLHGTAAWLASMVPDVFHAIMETDPEVLLRSDVTTAEVKDRENLVKTLLRLYNEEKLLDSDWSSRTRYHKLSYPGLADQLRLYIRDSTKGIIARRVAIDIAEACGLQTLQDDLVATALDPDQPPQIRVEAAHALGRIADENTKAKLKPLALGEAGDDPGDELKGCGLQAVWPNHITTEELFSCLTSPKQRSLFGVYQKFLLYDLPQNLQPRDLPAALDWVALQPGQEPLHPFEKLVDAIMVRAWEYLDAPEVLQAFAKAALARLRQHEEILKDRSNPQYRSVLQDDDEKRRQVLKTMLQVLSETGEDPVVLFHAGVQLILVTDIPWMIERLQASTSEKIQRSWARLIERRFNWSDLRQGDAVLTACQENPILAEALGWLRNPSELGSPEAQEMRVRYQEMQEWQNKKENRPLLQPPPAERIASLLNACETDNVAAWWRLNMEMTLEPNSTYYGDEFEPDLTTLPGWKTTDSANRIRIIEAAKRYILEQDPQTSEWLGKDTFHRPALAGYRALRLLSQEAPDFVSVLPADVWRRWASTILSYPTSSPEEEKIQEQFIERAYQYAPREIRESLMILIDKENEGHGNIFIVQKVEGCWDDQIANALLAKLKDGKLKPKALRCLLNALLDHRVKEAESFATTLVYPLSLTFSCPLSFLDEEQWMKGIFAACALMIHAVDAGWSVVWPTIQQNVEFGRELISIVAYEADISRIDVGQRLTEAQLADLYIWLVHQYPYAEDPEHDEWHYIGARESVAMWRDSLLQQLKGRGTLQACEAIRRIARELPDLHWLKWTLLEAQAITRCQTWVLPQPDDILKLANNQQTRLIQSGDQLLEAIIESLKRLEVKLQGETPAAIFLWDRIKRNIYKPKDENSFSDYVKIHLDEDLKQRGIIANREVEIRRGIGSGQGERTDIHVDAVMQDQQGKMYDSVTVIIEVKGCWHPELDRAMKTQLMDRYLRDNHCKHGLYLVGWFNCNQWNDCDYRKQQVPRLSINEAQKLFDSQAEGLSQEGMRIKAFVMNTALR